MKLMTSHDLKSFSCYSVFFSWSVVFHYFVVLVATLFYVLLATPFRSQLGISFTPSYSYVICHVTIRVQVVFLAQRQSLSLCSATLLDRIPAGLC